MNGSLSPNGQSHGHPAGLGRAAGMRERERISRNVILSFSSGKLHNVKSLPNVTRPRRKTAGGIFNSIALVGI